MTTSVATVWIKLRDDPALSWHLMADEGYTRCGREASVPCPTRDDLPMEEKSCESCLRFHERDVERVA